MAGAGAVTTPAADRTRCWTCGAPQHAHPYRHPFRRVPRPRTPEDRMTAALDAPATDHEPTTTTLPHPTFPRRWQVRVACSCLLWEAAGTVNIAAPAFRPGVMETRLLALHIDHRRDEPGPS
jgi:hypothetical protein